MKAETIKAIFTNLLFVIGVILLIIGFVIGAQTATKLIIFDQYPLNAYEETRCGDMAYLTPVIRGEEPEIMSEAERQQRQEQCLAAVEHQRRVNQTSDIVMSLTMLIAGGVLIYSFKRFIFNK